MNIVAHSMGGLVARRYILDYGSDDIDHLVTVGSPFWGAPVSIYRMLAGGLFGPEALGGAVDFLNNTTVINLLKTLPGFHELFPTNYYLQNNGGLPCWVKMATTSTTRGTRGRATRRLNTKH